MQRYIQAPFWCKGNEDPGTQTNSMYLSYFLLRLTIIKRVRRTETLDSSIYSYQILQLDMGRFFQADTVYSWVMNCATWSKFLADSFQKTQIYIVDLHSKMSTKTK